MAIPDFQAVMLPILETVADGQEHAIRDVTRQIADRFGLTEDEFRRPSRAARRASSTTESPGRRPT